jgi:protein-L-isoaspartate(D-aspartate) O-methyltransferase
MRFARFSSLLLAASLVAACGDEGAPEIVVEPTAAPSPGDAAPQAPPAPEPTDDRAAEREWMVAHTIQRRDVQDPLVLAAMRRVPRHLFMPPERRDVAYEDRPVPIGWDQTISQPYIVASMTEEVRVRAGSRVLEIGTGSGYQAAVLAAISDHVFSIEIKEPLARRARRSLDAAGFSTVTTKHGDGYHGWAEHAPFDAIVVTAAAPHVPPPLVKQLAPGGRMVIPVGPAMAVQDLMLVTKDAEGTVRTQSLYPVRFVPLTGTGAER